MEPVSGDRTDELNDGISRAFNLPRRSSDLVPHHVRKIRERVQAVCDLWNDRDVDIRGLCWSGYGNLRSVTGE